MTERPDSSGGGMALVWIVTGVLIVCILGAAIIVSKGRIPEEERPVPPLQTGEMEPPPGIEPVEKPFEPVIALPEQALVEEARPDEDEVPSFASLDSPDLPHNLILSSSRFREKLRLPLVYTCYRNNVSPPLQWKDVPDKTQSLALFLTRDEEETPFVSWALFNIAPDRNALPGRLPRIPDLEDGSAQALTDHNNVGYSGPCEPRGRHKYTFRLFVLDKRLDLEGGVRTDDVLRSMNGHVLDADEFIVEHYLRF